MANCGDILGRYIVSELIGEGGMSRVYKVIDTRLDTVWAMKEIMATGNDSFSVGLKETDILKELNHPSLPRIVDVVKTEDTYCLIMDYIEGINLDEYVKKNGKMSENEVLKIAYSLLDALIYLHSKKRIIYRDLKPSNIMLDDGGIKIVDFGISSDVKTGERNNPYLTREYAAPESLSGKGNDERSDIYSLGATLKFIVSDDISFGFKFFLDKCMKHNPKDRFQSAKEAKDALLQMRILNEKYYRKLRRAINQNLFYFIMFVLTLLGVFFCEYYKNVEKKNEFELLNEKALNSKDASVRIDSLIKLLDKNPQGDLYLRLLNEFKADYVFDEDEEAMIETLLERDANFLKGNGEYATLCREIGKLYLFYNNPDNSDERYKRSVVWFEKSLKEGGSDVETYVEIGRFFEDLKKMIIEGREKGMYFHFFEEISKLVNESKDCDERTRKDIYELSVDSVFAYSGEFYRDGVKSEEMLNLLSRIENEISANSNQDDMDKRIIERINEAKDEINYIEGIFD